MRNCFLHTLILVSLNAIAIGDDTLSIEAYEILKSRCYRCHGGAAKQADLDVLSRDSLLEERGTGSEKYHIVVPDDASKSTLLDTIDFGEKSYMPKEGSPEAKAMTDEEKDLLKRWVLNGATFPEIQSREFISDTQSLQAMRDFLLNEQADDRQQTRFYSLVHLYNNPKVSELDLRLYRAALSKAINSLSNNREIILPIAVPGTEDSVFAIRLGDFDWDQNNLWGEILSHYPYALKYDFVKDEELKQAWKDVVQFSGTDIPYLRADWFVVTATRPPLYHQLLDIPTTLSGLEHRLQLDVLQNFLNGKVQRSGFAKSGVSQQNRLIERHTTPVTPYFWISYDFLPKRAKGDLARFPLGPKFEGNRFNNQAFEHDGGEIIWSQANGMQAYMLIDAMGDRIDQGPIEVVFDRSAVLGNPAIVNGISCMYCHRDGMISGPHDEIRTAETLGGTAREHLLKVYPPDQQMRTATNQDSELFLDALEKAIGPFLKVGDDADKSIGDFPEPIGKVAELYARDLTPQQMACELGIENVIDMQAKIKSNRELLRFGLGTMVPTPTEFKDPKSNERKVVNVTGTLKREKWETRDGTSLMQDVAFELRLGLPYIPAN